MTPLLSIDALCVAIGGRAIIQNLTLQLNRGETLGLVGSSGSGKSTIALAIMGLLPEHARSSGDIHLHDTALMALPPAELQKIRGRDIGMVFQEHTSALNPLMRIGDQVAETARLHARAPGSQATALARAALDSVGLSGGGGFDRYPHELSGGQRQRAAIAMAVVLRPALLIADEPTTALDVIAQARVLEVLRDLVRAHHMGLILVSHDLAVIAEMAQRVVVLHEGRIVDEGTTEQTLANLRHPCSRALLAAAQRPIKRAFPATNGSAAILDVRGIVRDYPQPRSSPWTAPSAVRAVDHVSLTVHPGETVGLVGESGSGKSSLLRAILALEPAQAGEVRLLGEAFTSVRGTALRRLRGAIQAVFQDPYGSFDPRWSVERLIAEPCHLCQIPPTGAERRRRVAAVLGQVGLSPADALRRPHEFSGGERQRIAIARALITEPKVIVFDEAVSALDAVVRAQILDLLAELSSRLQLAYLFVSHDLNVVRSIADRIYVMRLGRIVEHGPTASVFATPRHEYTKALMAAAPRIRAAT